MLTPDDIAVVNHIYKTSVSNDDLLARLKLYFLDVYRDENSRLAWVVYQKLINNEPLS